MADQIVARSQTCPQWVAVAETMALFSWANFLVAVLCVCAAIAACLGSIEKLPWNLRRKMLYVVTTLAVCAIITTKASEDATFEWGVYVFAVTATFQAVVSVDEASLVFPTDPSITMADQRSANSENSSSPSRIAEPRPVPCCTFVFFVCGTLLFRHFQANAMKLVAFVAGVDNLTVAVSAEPDDSVAKMLDQVIQQLVKLDVPHEFSAYSTKRDGQWLRSDTPDYMALAKYDSVTMAQYLRAESLLDPTRKVHDYFGNGEVPEGIHIVVDWTSASWRESKIRADAEHARQLARQQEMYDDLAKALAIPSMPIVRYNLIIVALISGDHDCGRSSAIVQPGDTIANMVDLIEEINYLGRRNDYTAYSTKRDGQWLRDGMHDYWALASRSWDALARYETAEARFGETKTVVDYFADGVRGPRVGGVGSARPRYG